MTEKSKRAETPREEGSRLQALLRRPPPKFPPELIW